MESAKRYPVLEPLGVGELLDQAIRLYRGNFLKFIGIIAIVQIPLTLIQLIISFFTMDSYSEMAYGDLDVFGTFAAGLGAGLITTILSFILVQGVATATLTRSISDSYLGQPRDVISTLRSIGGLWTRILLALIFIGLLAIGLMIWTLIPCVGWFTGLGMAFYIGIVIVPLVAPIIVVEKIRPIEAVRRAWDLARRRFWWVLGFMLLLSLFAQLIITVPTTIINLMINSLTSETQDLTATYSLAQMISQSAIQLATSLIYLPFQLVAVTLLYFNLRVQTEGFDLAFLAQQEASIQGDIRMRPESIPGVSQGQLITRTEFGYFFLVTLLGVAIYVLLLLFAGLIGALSIGALGGLT